MYPQYMYVYSCIQVITGTYSRPFWCRIHSDSERLDPTMVPLSSLELFQETAPGPWRVASNTGGALRGDHGCHRWTGLMATRSGWLLRTFIRRSRKLRIGSNGRGSHRLFLENGPHQTLILKMAEEKCHRLVIISTYFHQAQAHRWCFHVARECLWNIVGLTRLRLANWWNIVAHQMRQEGRKFPIMATWIGISAWNL